MDMSAGRPVVAFSPHPLLLAKERELVCAVFLPGETIAEYLVRTGIAARMGRQPFRLKLDGRQLPRTLWAHCRPKPGTLIELYAVVRGGDGKKNPIATVAMIALMVYAPALGASLATSAGVGSAALWTAGGMVVGGMVINSVFPPPRPDLAKAQDLGGGDSPTYAIAGGSNRMRRYEPMPKILGVHRVYPDFGAQPYSEFHGAEQVGFYVLDFGYNDAELSDFKNGDTAIAEFTGIEYEISGADGKLALVPGNVDSQAGVELPFALGFVSRTSSPSTRALVVEITGSLFYLGDSGTEQRVATVDIEYRPVGGGAWTALTFEPDTVPATFGIAGVARVPAADYTRGVRKAVTVQPPNMAAQITLISVSVNIPAGVGLIEWTSKYSDWGAFRWTYPGGVAGPWVGVGGGGQFFLRDATGNADLLVTVHARVFPPGDAAGGPFTIGAEIPGQFLLLNASREPLRRTFFWRVADGQYEVRVKKSTPDETNQRAVAQLVWSQLRTYQTDEVDYTGRLRVGFKVNASALASGTLQQLSCIARAKCAVYPNEWTPVGLADVNGDGVSDIIWKHNGTGDVRVQLMDGATVVDEAALGNATGMALVAVGDFDGNGREELVWRSTSALTDPMPMWFPAADGLSLSAVTNISVAPAATMTFRSGDTGGDGKADLIVRDPSPAFDRIWTMDGATVSANNALRQVGAQWIMSAATGADLSEDGKSDIFWRDTVTGENYIFPMDGAVILPTEGYSRNVVDLNWTVLGQGQFDNADAHDVLWRNPAEVPAQRGHVYPMDLSLGMPFINAPAEGTIVGMSAFDSYTLIGVGDFSGLGRKTECLWWDSVARTAKIAAITYNGAGADASVKYTIAAGTEITAPRDIRHTSNPAFWYLDALRGKTIAGRRVWGAGLADARIDIEGLKAFAAWCDAEQLTFNGVLDQQLSVHDVLSAIALMGRGTPTMQTGKHGVLWDAPAQPVTAVFGMHNIVAGSFSIDYATGDLADVVEGSFVNPDLNWQRDFVRATVPGATSEARVRRVELFGCTNKAQAGEATNLYAAANFYRPRRYKWRSDWEQMSCPRGDVAQIGHDLLQLLSGRFIEGGSATVLKLPRKVPLYAGGAFITIRKPDATFATYAIEAGAGESDTLTPTAPLPFNPWADADGYPPYDYRWHYGPASDTGRRVKIESFKPVSLRHVDVTAVDEDPAYYAAKDNPLAVIAPPKVFGQVQLQALAITEDGVRAGNGYLARVYVTLDVIGDYAFCDVRASVNGGPMVERVQNQRGRTVFFDVSDFSDVVVEVTAYSSFGRTGKSSKLTAEHHVDYAGQSKPSDVRAFSIDGKSFSWIESPEVDVTGYIIRFHYGENLSPTDATPLHEGQLSASPATFLVLPSQVVTFFLTAIDAAGLESVNPNTIIKNLGDPALENVVVEIDFRAAAWPGTVTLGSNVGGDLVADDTTAFYGPDDAQFYSASADPFYEVSVFETMVYETAGFSFPIAWIDSAMVLQHQIEGEGIAIEYRRGNDDAFYGAGGDAFYGTGGDAFYGDPGEYVPFTGTVSFAQAEYQLRVTTNGGPLQGAIRALSLVIDVPDVRETINDLAVPAAGIRLALTKPFKAIKNVQLTLEQDGGAAVSARYVDKDLTLGPLIQAIDSTGASVAGRVDAHITGY